VSSLPVPEATDAAAVLSQWRWDPLTLAGILAAATCYGLGVIRLRRRGSRWPGAWTGWFACGLAVLVVALMSPVDAYADVSFTTHMGQHLLLAVIAPPLLALGAPVTLALRASSPGTGHAIGSLLRSHAIAFLARPVVGWLLFVTVPFVVHYSPLFDAALRSRPWHATEHAIWVSAALVYWWPIVGRDPSPHPVRYPVRMLSMFLVMPATSFLALALYSASRPLYPSYAALAAPWGPAALGDQRNAAVLMWLAGNLVMLVAMLLVAAAWKRDDDARQRRIETRADRLAAAGVESGPSGSYG
jgi:cytochrome c oxidase assembly factor CtaG